MANKRKRSNQTRSSRKSEKGDKPHPHHALRKLVKVLGYAANNENKGDDVVIRVKEDGRLIMCPRAITGRLSQRMLESFLIGVGFDVLLSKVPLAEIGPGFRELAAGKTTAILNRAGLHDVVVAGVPTSVYVWDGKCHFFGVKPEHDVLLTGGALVRAKKAGDLDSWVTGIAPIANENPGLLCSLCVTFSAGIRQQLDEPSFTMGLIAATSQGKTTWQKACIASLGLPEVAQWDGTEIGVREWLVDQPNQPVCLDDMHRAKFDHVAQTLMTVGNSATRMISKRAQTSVRPQELQCTLILSSERSLASMANNASAGLLARYFEVYGGQEHGMFSSLVGRDSGAHLAKDIDALVAEHHGTFWPKWLKACSKHWKRVVKWHGKKVPELRDAILQAAGDPEIDALTSRVLDRLTFAAFAGCVATRLKLWPIRHSAIIAAFGLLLKEHVDRSPPGCNALARAAIEAVWAYIEAHRGKFPPLARAGDPNGDNGIAGYLADDRKQGRLYLFIPDVFRQLFHADFGEDIYDALRAAGYLATQPGRGNRFTKRVPGAEKGSPDRMDFIAIREAIRFTTKPA